jgi:hypothetical protein
MSPLRALGKCKGSQTVFMRERQICERLAFYSVPSHFYYLCYVLKYFPVLFFAAITFRSSFSSAFLSFHPFFKTEVTNDSLAFTCLLSRLYSLFPLSKYLFYFLQRTYWRCIKLLIFAAPRNEGVWRMEVLRQLYMLLTWETEMNGQSLQFCFHWIQNCSV